MIGGNGKEAPYKVNLAEKGDEKDEGRVFWF